MQLVVIGYLVEVYIVKGDAMDKVEILKETKWVSLRRFSTEKYGDYDYLHEDRCDGKIIAILPYKIEGDIEFLLRDEITTCWKFPGSSVASITGGFEAELGVLKTVKEELAEEAGYEVDEKEFIELGTVHGTKSCDTIYYLYSIDLTGKEKTLTGEGDGSPLESEAFCYWSDSIDKSEDPMTYVMHHRLQQYLKGE